MGYLSLMSIYALCNVEAYKRKSDSTDGYSAGSFRQLCMFVGINIACSIFASTPPDCKHPSCKYAYQGCARPSSSIRDVVTCSLVVLEGNACAAARRLHTFPKTPSVQIVATLGPMSLNDTSFGPFGVLPSGSK